MDALLPAYTQRDQRPCRPPPPHSAVAGTKRNHHEDIDGDREDEGQQKKPRQPVRNKDDKDGGDNVDSYESALVDHLQASKESDRRLMGRPPVIHPMACCQSEDDEETCVVGKASEDVEDGDGEMGQDEGQFSRPYLTWLIANYV